LEHQIPNRPEIHLLTAEDPIERKLNFHNVDQNKITEKATSKILLKSFLRQDPDWILI
jgi:type II secretory ATPase GspE/PulE/Tfp pilus assembly ATPase PilB-like protein